MGVIAIKSESVSWFSGAPRELGRTGGARHQFRRMGFLDYTIPQKCTILAFLLEMAPGPVCLSLSPCRPPVEALSCLHPGWPALATCRPPLCPLGDQMPRVASGVAGGCSHRKVKSDHCLCPSWQEPLSRALTLPGPRVRR